MILVLPPPPSSLSTSGFRGGGGEVLGRDAGQLGGLTQSVRRRVPDEGHDPVSARAIELAFLVVARLRRGHFPVSVDVAYCKQKLFRDAVLLGCLLDLLHQRRALLGQDAVDARGFEQGHHGYPCPAQLQKVPPIHQPGRSFGVCVHTPLDDGLRPLAHDCYPL